MRLRQRGIGFAFLTEYVIGNRLDDDHSVGCNVNEAIHRRAD